MTHNADDTVEGNWICLGDAAHLWWPVRSGWGFTGVNTAWVAWGQPETPISINGHTCGKGLGSITTGELLVLSDGNYQRFEALIGVQTGSPGSVVFRVLTDGVVRFTSEPMTADHGARPVSLGISGVRELRLLVEAANGSPMYTSANWADARLLPSKSQQHHQNRSVDIVPFGRVVTSDPHRIHGVTSGRLEPMPAADVFLEAPAALERAGYHVPVHGEGLGCIGVNWSAHRRLVSAEWILDASELAPEPQHIQLQCWVRSSRWPEETAWQGHWEPWSVQVERTGDGFVWHGLDRCPNGPIGTLKVRWVITGLSHPFTIRHIRAWTASEWRTAELVLEADERITRPWRIDVVNGCLADPTRSLWCGETRHVVRVLYSAPGFFKGDRTLLHINRPSRQMTTVAVDDVLQQGHVYVPTSRLLVRRSDSHVRMTAVIRDAAHIQTIRQRVRMLPDQTRGRALQAARRVIKQRDIGPAVLSLPCENHKLVVERDGRFALTTPSPSFPPAWNMQVTPSCVASGVQHFQRSLHDGWFPIPQASWTQGHCTYGYRAMVAPFGATQDNVKTPWGATRPLAAVTYHVGNTSSQPEPITMTFRIQSPHPLAVQGFTENRCIVLGTAQETHAAVRCTGGSACRMTYADDVLTVSTEICPGDKVSLLWLLPCWSAACDDLPDSDDELLRDTVAYWQRYLQSAAQIETPDHWLNDLIRASQVSCLIAARSHQNGRLIAPWIGEMDYPEFDSEANAIIAGMDWMGHHTFAERCLDFFLAQYRPEGYLAHGYTMIGMGWHLTTLCDHVHLTAGLAWVSRHMDKLIRGCRWIAEQRSKTADLGLMPPGVVADWNAYGYTFTQNGYYWLGLARMADMLKRLRHPDAKRVANEAEALRTAICNALKTASEKAPVVPLRNGTWVRFYPMQAGLHGRISDFYPDDNMYLTDLYDTELGAHHLAAQGVIQPTSRQAHEMIDQMEDISFLKPPPLDPTNRPQDALDTHWFDLGGYASMQHAYCHNMELALMQHDVKPFVRSYWNSIAATVNTETLRFTENTYANTSANKTHTTGEFLRRTRLMLVMEHEGMLWLAAGVTDQWMHAGMRLHVHRAPTASGPISYTITSRIDDGAIDAVIDPPVRDACPPIRLHLRHPDGAPIRRIRVTGAQRWSRVRGRSAVNVVPAKQTIHITVMFGKRH